MDLPVLPPDCWPPRDDYLPFCGNAELWAIDHFHLYGPRLLEPLEEHRPGAITKMAPSLFSELRALILDPKIFAELSFLKKMKSHTRDTALRCHRPINIAWYL